MIALVQYFEHSLALPVFGIGIKTNLFQSCDHCWVFQICWHIEYSTLKAWSYRIWNTSAGIQSPPLALFVMMLPKAHWTSQSRISGPWWVITPSWLSGPLRSLLYISSMYSCHLSEYLLLLLGPYHFSPLLCSSLYEISLGISNFLEEISSLSHSIVFSISLQWSLRKAFLLLLAILWNSASKWIYLFFFLLCLSLLFFSQLFLRHPQIIIFPFWISFS